MDASKYRILDISRGLTYSYYFSPAHPSKPTILFIHGFPSTSWDWHKQIGHFEPLGYGIVAPDTLGYGGTSKPTDPEFYRASLVTKDLLETRILDQEGLNTVVAIGHDWGSWTVSRLANLHPERFLAFGFISVAYTPPSPDLDVDQLNAMTKKVLGYEEFGYWYFMSKPDAAKLIREHWDTFFAILWPHNPILWKTDLAPSGAFEAALLADKTVPLPSYLTEKDKQIMSANQLNGSIAASTCYYKLQTTGIAADEDKKIPLDRYEIAKPVFWAKTPQDFIGVAAHMQPAVERFCGDAVIKEYDAGHWVLLSHPEALNKDLQKWIEGLPGSAEETLQP